MANALKCDRCGNYFDYEPDDKNFIAFGHKDIIVGKNFPVKDICPNCMEQFMKWYENPDSYDPHDLVKNADEEYQKVLEGIKTYSDNDTDCIDRSNGATEKELELASKLNDAKIYIAQLKSELGYTMTKEEIDSLEARGFNDTKETNDNTEAKRFCNFDNCKFCSSLIRETLSCEPGIAAVRCAHKHKRLELRGANPNIIDAITPETFDEIEDPELSDPYEDGGL